MNSFLEQETCHECGYSVEHEIEFEPVELNRQNIVKICPLCGIADVVGERIAGEEFYF